MKLGGVLVVLASASISSGARAQPAPPLDASHYEGKIIIARGSGRGGGTSSASALFSSSPIDGAIIGTDGPCVVRTPPPKHSLSAGTITITGTVAPITLEPAPSDGGLEYKHSDRVADPIFEHDAAVTVEAAGGADISAFTATVHAPAALAGYAPPTELSRNGYTATWTEVTGSRILILMLVVDEHGGNAVVVSCRAQDTGTFTIPATTLRYVPPAFTQAMVSVARVAEAPIASDTHITVELVDGSIGWSHVVPLQPRRSTPPPPAPRQTPALFLSLGAGRDELSRLGDAPPRTADSWYVRFGQRIGRGLHLVEQFGSSEAHYLSGPSTITSEDHTMYSLGVRWWPFDPAPQRFLPAVFTILPHTFTDWHALVVTALVGLDRRDRGAAGQADATTVGGLASVSLGWLVFEGRDWAVGPELGEQVMRFDGAFQRDFKILLSVQLN